ncbi:MAG: hypothetical protein AVO34_02095 [Firmicutes bacterium ML8_F2]|jgi:D-alanyl-D-alanine carboxypeptidase|nr:MAG: hypothetical protein AVO34_02095 [Firmicutes bacterium ML8_F2]
MLVKFLITISVIFNPVSFLVGQLSAPKIPVDFSGASLINCASITAASSQNNPNFLPIRNWDIAEPETETKAALIFNKNKNKILYQKNIHQVLPIASLTKLMTALIVLENFEIDKVVSISKEAVAGYGDQGGLEVKEKLSIGDLLHALLMESSNDAAIALAEAVEEKKSVNFVSLMNQKTQELGLKNTYYADPSGYEPTNVSTAEEIVKLIEYSFNYPFIWEVFKIPSIRLSSVDGLTNHYWVNTDKMLNRLPGVIGGKTGYTDEAQGCLFLVIEQKNSGYLISVVLGAQERFLETERLINWVKKAYIW